MAAATAGVALSTSIGEKIYAGQQSIGQPSFSPNPFASDKKFVPVMITPYQKNGAIDFDGLSKLVDFYLAAGVKGFFANCASSEMYKLNPEERLSLARHVSKRVNGSMSVVATGSFGDTPEEKSEFTKRIYHTGINAVILITSHFAEKTESDDVLIRNFDQFLQLTDNIPVGTYECPAPYKRVITPKVFKYMLDANRFIYHKDTTIDLEKVKEKIAMIKTNRLEFYDACVANTMYSLQAGAKGMSAICGNFYPDIMVWMCENSTNPDRQEDVKWLQAQLTKTEDIIGQNYPQSAKYFLQKRGLPIETMARTATSPLTTAQKLALDDTYKVFLGWCDRIGMRPAKV
nr:dihydrodipicolinate synthase family protein [Flavihumibacter fluvii]